MAAEDYLPGDWDDTYFGTNWKNDERMLKEKKQMAEIWKPQDITVYCNWRDVIMTEASDDLTNWESNFIESIGLRLDRKINLSERQAEILERIYTEYTK